MARPLKPLFDQEEIERFIKPTLRGALYMYAAVDSEVIKTSEEGYLSAVLRAESFVLKLSHCKTPPEYQVRGKDPFMHIVAGRELLELGATWRNLQGPLYEGVRDTNGPRRTVLPRIMAFYQAFEPLLAIYSDFLRAGGEERGLHSEFISEFEHLLNKGFEDFQRAIRSPEVATRTKRLQTRINRNRLQQLKYLDSLLDKYHSLYVINLDLGYNLLHRDFVKRRYFDSIRQDFECFMKERRHNPLWKDDLAGYLWKLGDGVERGYHYNLMLFYRGESAEQHLQDKQKLPLKWIEEVTGGIGARYEQVLLDGQQDNLIAPEGIVSRKDSEGYERLIGFVHYLNKQDYLIQLDVPKGVNVYGRGQIAS